MLRILTQTKLNEEAFWPKPISKDFLTNSDKFWEKEYKEYSYCYISELDHLFTLLFSAITQLVLTEESFTSIINTLENFQKKCHTSYFSNYIGGIKQQLEIITYFFYSTPLSKKKQTCFTVS